jgi:galactose mutarotase-like enzyme
LRGAEALRWSVEGRDLLWSRASGHWDAVAPVLFPCVGWSNGGAIRVAGRAYPMPVHGFAASCDFTLIERSETSALFELSDSPATRARYPFPFVLRVRHTLTERSLRLDLTVGNPGRMPLPFALGLHPGFAWPFAGGAADQHRIVFAEAERPETPEITAGGLFTSRMRPVPLEGRGLALSHALFAREALCFLNARSRALFFEAPCGARIEASAEGFRHWALWSRLDAPFLCIEAWTGHGDPEGFAGEFADKPSMDSLAPGASRDYAMTWTFAPEPSSGCGLGIGSDTCENGAQA